MSDNLPSILWAIGYAPEKMGSFEEVMVAVAKKTKENNVRICFLFPGKPIIELTDRIRDAGGIIKVLPIKNRLDLKFILKFVSLLKMERIGVVHSHFDFANFPILLSRLFYREPLFFWHQHHITGSKYPIARKAFYWYLAREAKKVIAISKAVKNDLMSKGLKEEKIELVYNGFDIGRFKLDYQAQAVALRSEFNISAANIVISCIAQGRPEKGQLYLIEAFRDISDKYPDARLLLAGAKGHPYFSVLNELADRLKIKEKIIFTEMRNDIPEILYITDIVVIPSLSEGLSYCALEAMASGKPVIASNVGGLPELIDGNKTGILVAPKDVKGLEAALNAVISDKTKRGYLADNAREFIRRSDFGLKSMVEKIYNIYGNKNG
ncbi:MAG: glycosyltransferase family 4 protein [Candidatus Omnitrophica bacterium]|jgi:glycosyltransferase involved in cell wall biosynthesis|nr:glycosyltransferase family 4 protein [Syntrophorhabdaceae bacterium]MDD5424016.1 glycosyltransferase family 4 protein [Candidatus Omnitrophota bacterium]